MKLIQLLSACTLFGALAGSAVAIPYASKIAVSSSVYASPFTVSYMLNESADSVTIEILNGSTAVASFAGTTTQGANQVTWDGTADNAGGAAVADGNYTVRITADKNRSAWEEIASQRSSPPGFGPANALHNQVFNGYSPNDVQFVRDTNSDHFGMALGYSPYNSSTFPHVAAIQFNSDLSTIDGSNGYDNRIFKLAVSEPPSGVVSYDIWSGAVDPDNSDAFYWTGQKESPNLTGLYYGDLANPENIVNCDPNGYITGLPRSLAVRKEGDDKFVYFVHGNSTIRKAQIDPNTNELMSAGNVITSFATTNRYGKQVEFDADGNLYFVSKHIAAGADGVILRWSASQIAGANPAVPLSEANSDWNVTFDTSMINLMGIAITPSGDVYASFAGADATAVSGRGIYSVGNVSSTNYTKVLGVADRIIDLSSYQGVAWNFSAIDSGIHSDPAGNVIMWDRRQEQMRLFAPPANSSLAIDAPASQAFTVGEVHEPKNPVLVDAGGAGDYLTIHEAIASWSAGGENASGTAPFTATAPFVIKVRPSTGPYDEVITLDQEMTGRGDIVGDIVIESEVPGTPAVLKLKADTANGSDDGLLIQQNTHNVTLRDLVFTRSISDTAAMPTDELVRVDETAANSDMNVISFYNCVFTEVGTDGEPMVTNKAASFNPPPARGGPARTAAPYLLQSWGDPGESVQLVLDNCVLYGGVSSNAVIYTVGSGPESVKIHNTVNAWAGSYAYRLGGPGGTTAINPDATFEFTGTDQSAGPLNASVVYNPLNNHCIWFENTSASNTAEISNTILYAQGTASTPPGANNSRGISGGNINLTISDSLIYVPTVAIVDTSHNDLVIENSTIVTPSNAVLYTGTATGGKLIIRDSIIAGGGTKINIAPPGGVEIFNSAFPTAGPHAIGAIGGGAPTTVGLISADPMFISTDATLATFLDVDNAAYATAASDNGPLSGGADYVGSSDVSDWSVY